MGNNIYNYDLLLVINSEGVANEKNYSDGDARRRYTNLLQSNSHLSRSLNTHQDYVTTKKTGHNFIQHILFHHTLSIWAVTSTHQRLPDIKYILRQAPHTGPLEKDYSSFSVVFSVNSGRISVIAARSPITTAVSPSSSTVLPSGETTASPSRRIAITDTP